MIENSLNKCSDLLERSFNVSPVPTILLDIKGKVIKFNAKSAELTGYESKAIIGKNILSLPFISSESLSEVKKNFLRRLGGKKINGYDIKIKAKDGRELIGSVLGHLIKNKYGLPIGSIVVINDVTEQRRIFKDLEELQKQTEKYLDVSESMIVVLGRNAEIKLINRMGLKLLGYTKNEIVGKNWVDTVIPKEIRSKVRKIFAEVISGENDFQSKNENEIITKNGEKLLISWHNTVLKDDDGQINASVSSGIDLTSQRKTSKSLKEAKEMISLVMNHSKEVYYINSIKYNKLDYISEQCIEMMGYSPEELKKDWTVMLSDSPINKTAIKNTKEAIKTGDKQPIYLMEIKTKDGVIKMTEVDETPIKDSSGKVTGLSGVVRDISDRVKMDMELERRVKQLESINKVVVGRELKMIELKKKIDILQKKLEK